LIRRQGSPGKPTSAHRKTPARPVASGLHNAGWRPVDRRDGSPGLPISVRCA